MNTAYKVLRTDKGHLYSAFAEPPFKVEYIPGEWTTAPIGKLFCFNSLEAARDFNWDNQFFGDIWRVKISDSTQLTSVCWYLYTEHFSEFWATPAQLRQQYDKFRFTVPKGTIVVSKLKLLEQVR